MRDLFVPGRLCLFGEHSDWAGERCGDDSTVLPGACVVAGTDQGLSAGADLSEHFEFTTRLPDGSVRGPMQLPMREAALRAAARAGEFFGYVAGVAAEVCARYGAGGVRIGVAKMDLPLGRGLSSSAAACVLTARAFNRLRGLGLTVEQEMELAYRGELASGSRCGRMDQACAFGRETVLLRFEGTVLRWQRVQIGGPLWLLVVDLRRGKDTRRILADLQMRFDASDTVARRLRDALGPQNVALVRRAVSLLATGDAPGLGRLMTEAQSVFDRDVAPASPAELAAPALHALLREQVVRRYTWGGKGVGSQGDGTAQFVCRSEYARAALAGELRRRGLESFPVTLR